MNFNITIEEADTSMDDEILKFCVKCCGKKTTIKHILNDTEKCNFCDVPYIILRRSVD